MSDIEQGLKEAIQNAQARDPLRLAGDRWSAEQEKTLSRTLPPDPFKTVRLRTRGALVAAHHDMKPRDGWVESDEIIWDMVTAWLDSLGDRS